MKTTIRYKIVLEGTYEADPMDYDTDDPNEIAEIDRQHCLSDPGDFIELFGLEATQVVIIPE